MNLRKEKLEEIRDFCIFIEENISLKEKKAILTLETVDIGFILNITYCLLEEKQSLEDLLPVFTSFGITTGILLIMINTYFDIYKEENVYGEWEEFLCSLTKKHDK